MAQDGTAAGAGKLDAEMRAFLAEWTRASMAKDVTAASALRTEDYRASYPDDRVLLKADELAGVADPGVTLAAFDAELIDAAETAGGAVLRFDAVMRMARHGEPEAVNSFRCRMETVRSASGGWQARRMEAGWLYATQASAARPATPGLGTRLKRRLTAMLPSSAAAQRASFQELAYQPYRPGEDYVLPRTAAPAAVFDEAELPVPPVELWLGYDYRAQGAEHVARMFSIASDSGFELRDGDRVLDLGCGAGRMIRHLAPHARTCEIWGADISAEHIFWCKRHLSPPFRFLTNTKVPHLPFADGSFRFIYCGSLFTHIDDLADGWLLELRRLLSEDGRLYVTIHDEHTMALFDAWEDAPPLPDLIRSAPAYAEAKAGFDMFTVGRDNHSQVFYARNYFERMASSGFELLSVTPEAYFYQTAVLLAPR